MDTTALRICVIFKKQPISRNLSAAILYNVALPLSISSNPCAPSSFPVHSLDDVSDGWGEQTAEHA